MAELRQEGLLAQGVELLVRNAGKQRVVDDDRLKLYICTLTYSLLRVQTSGSASGAAVTASSTVLSVVLRRVRRLRVSLIGAVDSINALTVS